MSLISNVKSNYNGRKKKSEPIMVPVGCPAVGGDIRIHTWIPVVGMRGIHML